MTEERIPVCVWAKLYTRVRWSGRFALYSARFGDDSSPVSFLVGLSSEEKQQTKHIKGNKNESSKADL